ncbi:MAG: hypothetical protein IKH87_01680 [Firmicutes bacterium]|nr:hypothetical protein [Bacillota bacterium]MBR6969421.1 hypothetical protein [Bacillota bacterium]
MHTGASVSPVTMLSLAAGRLVAAEEFAEALIEEFDGKGEIRKLSARCSGDAA